MAITHCDCGGTGCDLCIATNCPRCYATGPWHELDMDNASYHDIEWGATCTECNVVYWFDYEGHPLPSTVELAYTENSAWGKNR